MARRRQEERRRAAPPVAWCGHGVVAPPVCAAGVSLLARGGRSGATPRGQPWTSAVTLLLGCNGRSARRMVVLGAFRVPSLGRHVPRECLRSAWRDLTPLMSATACHQRNYVERYSRCTSALVKAWV